MADLAATRLRAAMDAAKDYFARHPNWTTGPLIAAALDAADAAVVGATSDEVVDAARKAAAEADYGGSKRDNESFADFARRVDRAQIRAAAPVLLAAERAENEQRRASQEIHVTNLRELLDEESAKLRKAEVQLATLRQQLAEAQQVVVKMAIPLEVLYAVEMDSHWMSPTLKDRVAEAVKLARESTRLAAAGRTEGTAP